MIVKQTFKNHIIVSGFTWILTGIFIGLWKYLNYDSDFFLIAGLFHLLFSIPAIFLHIEYSIRNAGEEIEIVHNEVIVRKNGKEQRYFSSDIAKIIFYKSASLDKGGMPFSAMEYYNYARIVAKSGEEIIVTCLMTLKIEEALKTLTGIPIERKKRIAFLFWK